MALAGAKPMGLCFAPTSTKIRTPISAVKTLKNNVLIFLISRQSQNTGRS